MSADSPMSEPVNSIFIAQNLQNLTESITEIKTDVKKIDNKIGGLYKRMEDNRIESKKDIAEVDKRVAVNSANMQSHIITKEHHSPPCPFVKDVEKNLKEVGGSVIVAKKEGWQTSTKILATIVGLLGSACIALLIFALGK